MRHHIVEAIQLVRLLIQGPGRMLQGELGRKTLPRHTQPPCEALPRLAHKTTDRALYDRARAALPAGVDEYLFLNERGEAAEGTITTLFFDLGDGLRTPPLSSGCLPGCLRAELLATGRAREEPLPASLLPRAKLWMGNSLRGLIPAVLPAP